MDWYWWVGCSKKTSKRFFNKYNMSTKVEFKYSELFGGAVIDAFKKLHPRDEIKNHGKIVGSVWLAQQFQGTNYFWPRPSACY